jgi:hypothetical protein
LKAITNKLYTVPIAIKKLTSGSNLTQNLNISGILEEKMENTTPERSKSHSKCAHLSLRLLFIFFIFKPCLFFYALNVRGFRKYKVKRLLVG